MKTSNLLSCAVVYIVCGFIFCSAAAADSGSEISNSLGMTFVRVKAGCFTMGASPERTEASKSELPRHEVCITDDFYLGKTEVTQAQWDKVMSYNKSKFKGADLPMENVSWTGVQEYIKKLNDRNDGYRYRLPTEAEWEYAARAGTKGVYSIGKGIKRAEQEKLLSEYAWYRDNSDNKSHPVATKKPNPWGLYDMYGNVSEWCNDIYDEDYYGKSPKENPQGPKDDNKYRSARGGSWSSKPEWLHSGDRGSSRISTRNNQRGFRLVLEPAK